MANFDKRRVAIFIGSIALGLLIIAGIVVFIFRDNLFPDRPSANPAPASSSNTSENQSDRGTASTTTPTTNDSSRGQSSQPAQTNTTAPQAAQPSTSATSTPSTGPTDSLTIMMISALLAAGTYAAMRVILQLRHSELGPDQS